MRGLRVLITNNTLGERRGSELYVRDVAIALLRLGHRPIAYSRSLGQVAEELRLAAVPVVDDFSQLGETPDLIHGHHNLETMTALLRLPATPAVFFCHGWLPWEEAPPPAPRILKYVAIDEACRDRLALQNGITPDRIEVVPNFVDLERFRPRAPLPPRPQRALVFSNYATDGSSLPAIRAACAAEGLDVDVAGYGCGRVLDRPEAVLGSYDLVFAKARAALEAMAVGTAVIACDFTGLGGFVSPDRFDEWRRLNFGLRCLHRPLDVGAIRTEIRAYDPAAAAAVSRRVRCEAGLDTAIHRIVTIYQNVLEEWRARPTVDPLAEAAATAAYLRQLEPRVKTQDRAWSELLAERNLLAQRLSDSVEAARGGEIAAFTEMRRMSDAEIETLRATRAALENRIEEAERETKGLRLELEAIRQLSTFRLRAWLFRSPKLVSFYQTLRGRGARSAP